MTDYGCSVLDDARKAEANEKRPLPVTLVTLLALVAGTLTLLAGVLLLITAISGSAEDATNSSTELVVIEGIAALIVGIGLLSVYKGLKFGYDWARKVFTLLLVVAILIDIFDIINGRPLSTAIFGIIIDGAAIFVLWGMKSARDFYDPKLQADTPASPLSTEQNSESPD